MLAHLKTNLNHDNKVSSKPCPSITLRVVEVEVRMRIEEAYQHVALHVVQGRGVGGVALLGVSDLERGDV